MTGRHDDQYLFGVKDPSLVDPDSWTIDTALIDRPGIDEMMLDFLGRVLASGRRA